MDDISLIGHMIGGGEELAQNLRDKGFVDLKSIIGHKPADLANGLGTQEEIATKIISAAKAILKSSVTLEASASSKKIEKKAKEPKMLVRKETKPIPKRKNKTLQKHTKPLTKRYWKKLLPLVVFTLIGLWLLRRY